MLQQSRRLTRTNKTHSVLFITKIKIPSRNSRTVLGYKICTRITKYFFLKQRFIIFSWFKLTQRLVPISNVIGYIVMTTMSKIAEQNQYATITDRVILVHRRIHFFLSNIFLILQNHFQNPTLCA